MIRTLAPELDDSEPGRLRSVELPSLRSVIIMDAPSESGTYSFDDLRKLGGSAQQIRILEIDKKLCPDDAINIQFTSGTTGMPKGATLSHYNIVNNARYATDRIN